MHNAVCVVKQILLLKKEEHFLIGSRDSFQYYGLYYMDDYPVQLCSLWPQT